MDRVALGKVLGELKARGFGARRQRQGIHRFQGNLACRGEVIQIEFAFSDLEFLTYPSIKVLSGVDKTLLTPHLFASGGLCYFQEGSVVLDRYDPAGGVAQCLDQAQQILELIKFDPRYRRKDIQDEFMVHWSERDASWPVVMGTVSSTKKSTNYWRASIGKKTLMILADDPAEVTALAKSLDATSTKPTTCPCWLLKSDVPPFVPTSLPTTVHDLFVWLKSWDLDLYRQVHRLLGSEKSYLQYGVASFAVKSIAGWLCFGFELDGYMSRCARRRPSVYRQYLHGRGGSTPIFRYSVVEAGSDFVHSRNLTFPDLKSKRICIVGCGAIGSHLAPALVRLGAGTGSGSLTLIDEDTLGPENLGRHTLGYPSLFQSKSVALKKELDRQFPMANLLAISEDVMYVKTLLDSDLVIDATGEEAVSELLNARRLAKRSNTPVLHVWILGNGDAVQALWAEGSKAACYRCLRKSGPGEEKEQRYPVLKHPPQRGQIGCRAFTPYAVSAAMQSAALAAEMIVDWLKRADPGPRFRTRSADNADVHKVKNQNPDRLTNCPACANAR
jgi:molybdopterin/thiamine biosynthesis adenylyltransferase